MVWPTISGKMVEARDQVLITWRWPLALSRSTLRNSLASIYGPFFSDRLIVPLLCGRYLVRRRTISRLDGLFGLRVRLPIAGLPQGVCGCPPIGALPSPPPCGWSRGFIAEPRTVGRRPSQRLRPALPSEMVACSGLPTEPTVAMHAAAMVRTSPE